MQVVVPSVPIGIEVVLVVIVVVGDEIVVANFKHPRTSCPCKGSPAEEDGEEAPEAAEGEEQADDEEKGQAVDEEDEKKGDEQVEEGEEDPPNVQVLAVLLLLA